MAEGRPAIPRELRRAVLVEAGHRCAIPRCRAHPVDVEHIDDWAKVKDHRFENLIALCPTCHRRKGNGPDQIDRKALRQYKANLSLLNHRYGELERRVLTYFAGEPDEDTITLPAGMDLMVMHLVRDEYLSQGPVWYTDSARTFFSWVVPVSQEYWLTPDGRDFVQRWANAEPLD